MCLAIQVSAAAQEYQVTGMVLTVDRSRNIFTASIQAIPGLMPAMAMPFEVRQTSALDGLVPGAAVEFVLVVDQKSSYAERIRIVRYESVEQDPLAANRLKL
ncbi:MAG TPA: copper-binding protein, partial [Vicinamibacterales bacterium]